MTAGRIAGRAAVAAKGRWQANKWLVMRRTAQLSFLGLFLLGPWAGIWIVKGNLASSLTLDVLPLTDPYVALQALVAGHAPEITALLGAVIVVGVYLAIGGRMYCSWVCPVNIVTDAAAWLHERLRLPRGWQPARATRLWVLAMTLVIAALTGTIAWEFVNPVSMLHRGIIFGLGSAWTIVLAVFLFDLFVSRNGWCGHICPVGAFYGLLGSASVLRVSATARRLCDDCMDCYAVCPEPHVITPALRGEDKGVGPTILSRDCTNCGRCIDVCPRKVFAFGNRFRNDVARPARTAATGPGGSSPGPVGLELK